MPTDLVFHECFMKHAMSPGHPECPERLAMAMEYINGAGLLETAEINMLVPQEADLNDVYPIHDKTYIEEIRTKSEMGGGFFTLDTSANEFTYKAALLAAGGGIRAVDRIQDASSDNAYVLCRPPGHHAERARAYGFCFINNIAVAAHHLTEKHGLERVLIVDYDAHHGNGTQNVFYSTDKVLYIGLHQDGRTQFPGSGFPDEIGSGKGEGYNVNLAMYPGAGNRSYDIAFTHVIEPIAECFQPEFVLVSVGFDGHFNDPLTSLGLTTSGFAMMNARLNLIAKTFAQGRLTLFLEGGYNLDVVGMGSQNLLEQIAGVDVTRFEDIYTESDEGIQYTKTLVEAIRKNLEGVWF